MQMTTADWLARQNVSQRAPAGQMGTHDGITLCDLTEHSRIRGPFWAVFLLRRATFSDATEPRPFWYGCQKLENQYVSGRTNGSGFEKLPLRRSEQGSKLSGSAPPLQRRFGRFTLSSGGSAGQKGES